MLSDAFRNLLILIDRDFGRVQCLIASDLNNFFSLQNGEEQVWGPINRTREDSLPSEDEENLPGRRRGQEDRGRNRLP